MGGESSGADEVRAARAAMGMTQRQLSEKLGVTLRAVQHWEGGARKPSNPVLMLLRKLAGRKPGRGAAKP